MALRELKGWGREELAFRARVSLKTVTRIEKGQVEGRRATIRSIADALEVDEFDILGERPNQVGLRLTDQVDGVRDEFRADVDEIKDRLASIETTLDQLNLDGEVARQLAMQTQILKDIQNVVAVLKGVRVVSEPTAATGRKVPPAPKTTPDRLPRRDRSAPIPKPSRTADASTGGKDQDRRHGAA